MVFNARDIIVLMLGTYRSKAVYIVGEEIREVIMEGSCEHWTRSYVSFINSEKKVGLTRGNIQYPDRTVENALCLLNWSGNPLELEKEKLFSSVPIEEGDDGKLTFRIDSDRKDLWSPEEIIGIIAEYLVNRCKYLSDSEITRCAVVIPDHYSDADKECLRNIIEKTGVRVVCQMTESESVSYYLQRECVPEDDIFSWENSPILLYNMGARGFTASVIRLSDENRVLATTTDFQLGGRRLIELVIKQMMDDIDIQYGVSLLNGTMNEIGYQKEYRKLVKEVEECFLSLHYDSDITIDLPFICRRAILRIRRARQKERRVEGQMEREKKKEEEEEEEDPVYTLSEAKLRQLLAPLIQGSFKVCEVTLMKAGLQAEDVFRVVPLGGCCYNKVIEDALLHKFSSRRFVKFGDRTMSGVLGLGYYVRDYL